jgi:uncharacterized membrane protein SpoIIM required for sporulation
MPGPEATTGVAAWLTARAAEWRTVAQRAERAGHGTITAPQAVQLTRDYRSVARDLASARRHLPGAPATRALEALYFRLHALHRAARATWREALADFFLASVPASYRCVRPILVWTAGWFFLCVGIGWWLINWQPELVSLFLPEDAIAGVESGQVWTDQIFGIAPPAIESIGILSNNISVALMGLVMGLLLGLGAIYLLGLNGLMLGAAFAFTHQHGLAGNLGRFIIAHGMVEISVICLSVAAGTYIGDAVVRPAGRSRAHALREAVGDMAPLLGLCSLMLVGCGFIEGYLSPDPDFPAASRLVVGGCWWLVLAGLLAGPRRPASHPPARA